MSLEVSLTSRTHLPSGGVKSASPPPADGGVSPGAAPGSATPAAVYTPGVAPSNAGAYFRPAPTTAGDVSGAEASAAS